MTVTRTMTQLIADVREEGDLEDLVDRHPPATLAKWINKDWRRLRTKLAGLGFPLNRLAATGNLPTSPTPTDEQFLQVNYPAEAVYIYGVDVLVGGKWWPLKPGNFSERRDYVSRDVRQGAPTTWVINGVTNESPTAPATGLIHLYPLSTGGQSYKVWYLPNWTDISETPGTGVFYGHDIWFDWLTNAVICRAAKKDDDSQDTYKIAKEDRAECWKDIVMSATRINSAEPFRPRRRHRR